MKRSEFRQAMREYAAAERRAGQYLQPDEVDAAEDRVRETEAVLLDEFDRLAAELARKAPVYDAAMAYVEGWLQPLPFDPMMELHLKLLDAYRKAMEDGA